LPPLEWAARQEKNAMSENETDRETEKRKSKPIFKLQPSELSTGDESLRVQLEKLTKDKLTLWEEIQALRGNLEDDLVEIDVYHDALLRIASGGPNVMGSDAIGIAREALGWSRGLKSDDDDKSVDVTASLTDDASE
jgi:hypothetical protein